MSAYEKYDEVSKVYDLERLPCGYKHLLGQLSVEYKDLSKLHVLDAGCGTGNMSEKLLENGVVQVTLLDASKGMLECAINKLSKHGSKVVQSLVHELPSLPFPDESFDVVMFNLVLHHLEDGSDPKFTRTAETFKEAYRVLKKGGMLYVTTLSHEQLSALWYASLVDDTAREFGTKVYMPKSMIKTTLKDLGYANLTEYALFHEHFHSMQTLYDYKNIFDDNFIRSTSTWTSYEKCSPGSIERARTKLQEMIDANKVEQFIQSRIQNCDKFGNCLLLCAFKN